MSKQKFNVSQEFELIEPEKSKAYPILIDEWKFIKEKITNINFDINWYLTFGSILIGASITCLITWLSADFNDLKSEYMVLTILGITFISGCTSLFFSRKERKEKNKLPSEVISQMELIESRFNVDE